MGQTIDSIVEKKSRYSIYMVTFDKDSKDSYPRYNGDYLCLYKHINNSDEVIGDAEIDFFEWDNVDKRFLAIHVLRYHIIGYIPFPTNKWKINLI